MIPPPESYEGDSPALQYRAAYRRAADLYDHLRFADTSVAERDAECERIPDSLGADALSGRRPAW